MNTTRWFRIGAGIAIALLLLVVARSLVVLPSPGEMRLRRMDALRVSHLDAITASLDAWYKDHGQLPAGLEALPAATRELVLTDPVTGNGYGYEVLDERRYRLCATFAAASPGVERAAATQGGWYHAAGEACWDLDVRVR